jgi:hypothetical protein
MRSRVFEAQTTERDGLMEIRDKYKDVPEEMFRKIYDYVKRNAKSVDGGKRKTKKRRNRRQRKSRRR